jgi:hypothetical protein
VPVFGRPIWTNAWYIQRVFHAVAPGIHATHPKAKPPFHWASEIPSKVSKEARSSANEVVVASGRIGSREFECDTEF